MCPLLALLAIAPIVRPAALAAQAAPSAAAAATAPGDLETLAPILEFIRARKVRDAASTSPNGIDEGAFVELGGIPQWITIRGENQQNPVLLVLHGGPGDATNLYTHGLFRPWLKSFTVVQWDQRGAGRTLGKNGSAVASSITLQRLTDDGIALAEHLRRRLEQPKVVLLGHSFGSILGVRMAKARPDLFHAFVGTGQVGDPLTGYTVAYDALVAKARATGQQDALAELEAVGPPPYADGRGFGVQRKWSNRFEGAEMFLAAMMGFALTAPGYTARDVRDWLDGQGLSAERLVPETSAIPPTALAGEFALPAAVIPYTIVHATQFFEFVKNIAAAATDGNTVRLAPVLIQPMAADDVARAVGGLNSVPGLTALIEPCASGGADGAAALDGVAALAVRVRREYEEMPGLRLTVARAARLFGLAPDVAYAVLDDLHQASVLTCTERGTYSLRR